MTVGSLFSGIGGLDLGLERAGHRVVWSCESNPYCRRVLAKYWPHVPCYEDVTTLTGNELAPVDLICGGFPCQPVSQAGQRKGLNDEERWLWPHFARILGAVRPRYALVENVPGLLTVNGGRAFGEVLGDLAEIGMSCEWDVLSAAQFGAKHLRNRLWIVAYAQALPERPRLCQEGSIGERRGRSRHGGGTLADTGSQRLEGVSPVGATPPSTGRVGGESGAGQEAALADADHQRCDRGMQPEQQEQQRARGRESHGRMSHRRFFDAPISSDWDPEPSVGRVATGVPHRVDRLRGLGNAVVPQVAEWLGHRLTDHARHPSGEGVY